MTDHGDYIQVEVGEAGLNDLLKTVREQGRSVRIFDQGTPVAELSPLPRKARLPPVDPRLKATFAPGYDPTAPLDESDWPERLR
jgi:antitoxin (DNA-binding transcriptional repressor) of toxin-antitoxin stability system